MIFPRKNTEVQILGTQKNTKIMEVAPKELKYPQKLTEHLKKLSVEKHDECKIYKEWDFSYTKDSGEAGSRCPCGKTGIRYLCYIYNKTTKNRTFVGTSCVEFFDDEMKEVLKLLLNLISVGITGKYKGEGKRGKKRFEVRANTNLVKKESRLKALFNFVPVYLKGNGKWEIQVFTTKQGLIEDQKYEMKIKSSRWTQQCGTGISFEVIQLDLIL